MKLRKKHAVFVLLLCAVGASLACGTSSHTCALSGVRVFPESATANHTALSPGNSQQFAAFAMVGKGCAVPQSSLMNVTWSVSDQTNVTISNAHDLTYGVATCVNATAGSVTVTATAPTGDTTRPTVSGTASLTCQ